MPELSNLLRQRLGAPEERPGTHPDPDTLTAFTEQLLPVAERQQVLAHLAACGECREVLALSQPGALEPAMQPVRTPAAAQPFWRRLFTPAYGLAASLAAVAIIAVVVLHNPQKPAQPQSNQEAKAAPVAQPKTADQNPPDQNASAAARPAAPAQPGGFDSFVPSRQAEADSRLLAHNQAPAVAAGTLDGLARKSVVAGKEAAGRQSAPQPALTAGLRKQDFLNNAFFEGNSADVVMAGQGGGNLPAAPQPQPSANQSFSASAPGQIINFSDIPPKTASNRSNVRILTPPPPPDRFGCTVCKMVTAGARAAFHRNPATTPAISSNSITFSAMGSGKFSSDLQKGQPAEVAAAPEKAETAGLERTDALSARSMSSGVASAPMPSAWKIIGGKLLRSDGAQWEDAYPAAAFQFTFVNTHGNEVWAGGSHAMLIHSRDGGATWETSHLGDAASGAVISIIFLGSGIQVKTSDDQSWSSSDGGKTWARN
jgi:Photosynthesis system II assembly factor YCF48